MKKRHSEPAARPSATTTAPADPGSANPAPSEPTTSEPTGPAVTSEAAVADATGGGAPADAGAEQEIAALAKEVAAQKDKYLRLYADYENYRKRAARERQEAELKGMGLLIKGILDTLDDLGRFAHLEPASTDSKTVVDGVELVERKLLKSLSGHGLEVVNPVDAAFDPTYHEAITTTPAANEREDHLVAQVYQVGYVFNGMLLRPARVVVKQWLGGAEPDAANASNVADEADAADPANAADAVDAADGAAS